MPTNDEKWRALGLFFVISGLVAFWYAFSYQILLDNSTTVILVIYGIIMILIGIFFIKGEGEGKRFVKEKERIRSMHPLPDEH